MLPLITIINKALNQRYYYMIDLEKNKLTIDAFEIDISPYWAKKDFFVFPGNEDPLLDHIENYLKELKGQPVMPNIIIRGYITGNDRAFNEKIMFIKDKYTPDFAEIRVEAEISSWNMIMQNQMVSDFVRKTADLDNDLRMKIFEIIFPIFSKTLK